MNKFLETDFSKKKLALYNKNSEADFVNTEWNLDSEKNVRVNPTVWNVYYS